MHKNDLNISINKLSKIEGHADLDIKVENGEVKKVDLRVMENKRFFNQAVVGQNWNAVPQMTSRICGTCSIAHMTGCIEAVEKTLGIKPSEQTILMRKLTMYSLMIRDHALHLYYFVMPDLYGVDSILDLADTHKDLVHESLHVKSAGNNLSNLIAGRAVHAPFEQVGGFARVPDEAKIPEVILELKDTRDFVLRLIDIFYKCDWKLERKTDFVALKTRDFSFLEGTICSSSGACIEESNFWDHLHSVVIPYSQASGFEFEGHEYMVGALARVNLNKDALHAKTKKDAAEYLKVFPSINMYHNNLAQAIEILHSLDHSIEILENFEFKKEEAVKPETLTGEGVGVIEAPRGTLYYWLGINEGKVRYANLVIPTAQNLINMREDIRQMVHERINDGEAVIRKEAEKIIRAYDPCMSCASHFLRVNWV
ncbi:MAG: Nickel-dependent hydrogenase large subunit [Candidatus Falkowbacteria bacterium GW2011_GWC2_38_22]|uniref:Nickel-dependent hydrogenase large subunit n=1 Tax=Candidatus Falkowbacteria bacterium GW2011_GWE1_38_31 TaxID=1618638 RepID=A0A0G0M8F9_9BACT|nr:MAG: Nickel-dependent hydrogenase large subunit [Candidatus Falkowbacteria bacterium GW2011_GWF2_38_1205]KKQ61123.1 MAG: Nickel-dependent hydrogenase large subunit [Candidatus Falkowbacteria bacterium GW2011_GWC2_38_22]KKQ63192.1 MAG: Nickel-dependent hydrogenase large subunit [Candidatus Falkowbacteria bacterium GW2011_GWF1_38_22]KKQ65387.1 MAG: Nickel-dependent hydrogenase large subunit [Candidatus Falkowbacteria bacterium GW2011_GWE2_38_254]KKQ69964.1 MAG: Nickel-dependent hydrogenase lar